MENQSSFLKAVSFSDSKIQKKKNFILKHNNTIGRNIHLLWSVNMILAGYFCQAFLLSPTENLK